MFRKEESINAILYIAQNVDRKDIHKICKILYFADREHLSKYGRSITGDVYIAMQFGPVPSKIEDIFKAVRGDSYFSNEAGEFKEFFTFQNRYMLKPLAQADMDCLSESEVECLDNAIAKCKDKSFDELTQMSHDTAWSNTPRDRMMSFADIIMEAGDTEEYANYISDKIKFANLCMNC